MRHTSAYRELIKQDIRDVVAEIAALQKELFTPEELQTVWDDQKNTFEHAEEMYEDVHDNPEKEKEYTPADVQILTVKSIEDKNIEAKAKEYVILKHLMYDMCTLFGEEGPDKDEVWDIVCPVQFGVPDLER